jgi:hypothetical protein
MLEFFFKVFIPARFSKLALGALPLLLRCLYGAAVKNIYQGETGTVLGR